MEVIGDRLKVALGQLNLTQTELADSLGVKVNQINRWATDKSAPNADYLLRIQKKTGLSIDWLLTGKGEMFLPDEQVEESSKSWIVSYITVPLQQNRTNGLISFPVVKGLENTHPIKYIREMQKATGEDIRLLFYRKISPGESAEIGSGCIHLLDRNTEELDEE